MQIYLLALFGCLFLTASIAFYKRSKLNLELVSREEVDGRELLAVRLESNDFLFVKEHGVVSFIQALDEDEEFEVVDLEDHSVSEDGKAGQLLKIPNHEKAS